MDIPEFTRRFTQLLVELAASNASEFNWEAERRYNTDAEFHAQINIIVQLAVRAIMIVDNRELHQEVEERYSDIFRQEAGRSQGSVSD